MLSGTEQALRLAFNFRLAALKLQGLQAGLRNRGTRRCRRTGWSWRSRRRRRRRRSRRSGRRPRRRRAADIARLGTCGAVCPLGGECWVRDVTYRHWLRPLPPLTAGVTKLLAVGLAVVVGVGAAELKRPYVALVVVVVVVVVIGVVEPDALEIGGAAGLEAHNIQLDARALVRLPERVQRRATLITFVADRTVARDLGRLQQICSTAVR